MTFEVTLAKDYTKFSHKIEWPAVAMPKLDGIRAVFRKWQTGDEGEPSAQYHFFTRNNKRWNDNVVEHILSPLRELTEEMIGDIIIDGEFYVHGWTCQKINSQVAVRRNGPDSKTHLVQYHIFDVIWPDSVPVDNSDFVSRIGYCDRVPWPSMVKTVHWVLSNGEEHAKSCYDSWMLQGYEGAMIRNNNVAYENKRTHNLLKWKSFSDQEFKCIDVYEGRDADHSVGGRLEGTLGGLRLITNDGKEFGCGSGFDDATRHAIWADPSIVVGKMVTVKYFEITTDGVPRFPIFQAVRDYE